MSFEMDEDILHDFLVEAGEILELLSEQLVDLEKQPDDRELLNAIFRGFHTVKGGAGFLSLNDLVDTCHGAENVFDNLRNGGRQLTTEVMDCILRALDTVNEQFAQVMNRLPLTPAKASLLTDLQRLSVPYLDEKTVAHAHEPTQKAETKNSSSTADAVNDKLTHGESVDEITDDEFEHLLDELHGTGKGSNQTSDPVSTLESSDSDITDDEFEKLLDQIHGKGNAPGTSSTHQSQTPKVDHSSSADEAVELVSDSEFEDLLDKLHGKGKGPNQKKSEDSPSFESSESNFQQQNTSLVHQSAEHNSLPLAATADNKKLPAQQAEQTVRVNTSTLDTIMNMVGELVLVRNRLLSIAANNVDENMVKAVTNLDVVTADLQGAVIKTRMQPIKKVFGRFPRVVRDLARTLNKEIVLEMRGEDTDLDKNLVEALADPMIHLIRNSVDHGIEMPDMREKLGKYRVGRVTLSASQEGDHILLTIEDDGGGMDAKKLRGIAVDRGLMDADTALRLTDNETYNLIFAPGFSTKSEISDISGRGVGMDVVKTGITRLNGTISIDSELGKGTKILIKVPLTLAILPTLMVGIGNRPFAFPLSNVNEIISLDLNKTNTVDNQLTLIVRDKAIPMFYLQDWLCKDISDRHEYKEQGHVVIIQLGHQRIAFVVDTLIGQEEVVIKPLDEMLQGTPGMAGATITSDGHIALILDVPNLLRRYAGH